MKVGQKVKWKSRGKGSYTTKVGTIIRIIKSGDIPWKIAWKGYPKHRIMFTGWGLPGGKKTKIAYFVEVVTSPTIQPRLYMPFPGNLRAVRSDAGTTVGLKEKS